MPIPLIPNNSNITNPHPLNSIKFILHKLFIFYIDSNDTESNLIIDITYKLSKMILPQYLNLKLSQKCEYLTSNFKNFTNIMIQNGAYTNFTYSLSDNNSTEYYLILAFSKYIPPGSLLTLQFFPSLIINSNGESYNITPDSLTIELEEFIIYSPEIKLIMNGVQTINSNMTTSLQYLIIFQNFLDSQSPNAIFTSSLIQMITILRYLKINYPLNLINYFASKNADFSANADVLPNHFENIFGSLYKYSSDDIKAPNKMGLYNVSPYYLDNIGVKLEMLIILVLLGCIVSKTLKYKDKFNKIAEYIISKLAIILTWNFTLSYFIVNYINFIFYGLIQLISVNTKIDNPANIIIAIFSLIFWLIPFFTAIAAIKTFRHHHVKIISEDLSKNNPYYLEQNCSILFKEYNRNTLSQLLFLTFYMIRCGLVPFIIIFFDEYPLGQISAMLLLNIIIIIYIIAVRPLNRFALMIQYIGNEVLFLVANLVIFVFAIFDYLDYLEVMVRTNIGWLIYGVDGCIIIWSTIFSIYFIFYTLNVILNKLKSTELYSSTRRYKATKINISEQQISVLEDTSKLRILPINSSTLGESLDIKKNKFKSRRRKSYCLDNIAKITIKPQNDLKVIDLQEKTENNIINYENDNLDEIFNTLNTKFIKDDIISKKKLSKESSDSCILDEYKIEIEPNSVYINKNIDTIRLKKFNFNEF